MTDNKIRENFVYLTAYLTNMEGILNHLEQHAIISRYEREEITSENTSLLRNSKLLTVILKKDWLRVRDRFIEILRQTNNEHCADKFEEKEDEGNQRINKYLQFTKESLKNSDIRKCEKIGKCWPDEMPLVKSLHERKYGDKLLVEELHHRILKDENRMVVICAKYLGMEGIGKTLTATWYANHYKDYYEHILWIDCGEGSLLASFKKLAMELEIKNWDNYTEVKDFARKCFETLTEFECLWIFDNAESLQEKEGIMHVLPKQQRKFSCLITSRSRDWGIENVGYWNISDFQLEIFSEEESLEFLRANLKPEIEYTEDELNELCRSLGYLPRALQSALAALNGSQMVIKTYFDKRKSVKVLDPNFAGSKKTIEEVKIEKPEKKVAEKGEASAFKEDTSSAANILKYDLVYLTENLRDITIVLTHLIQSDVITVQEQEIIVHQPTNYDKSIKLFTMLQTRHFSKDRLLLLINIFKETNNVHLADRLRGQC